MPDWLFSASEVSLAAAMVVFGLVLFLSPHREYTRMTRAVVPAVWFVAGLSLLHTHMDLPGWPLLAMGLVWWLLSYAAFRFLTELSREQRLSESTHSFGRRRDD